MTWSDFYVTVATAAATILGLLFVAVQFNLERLAADSSQEWLAMARSTWIILATLFFVALVYLIPSLAGTDRIVGTAIILLISSRRIVFAWLPVRRKFEHQQRETVTRTLWVMVGPLVLFALLFGYTVALVRGANVQHIIAYIVIALFALALRNSWDLLVELRIAFGSSSAEPDQEHQEQP